MPDFTGGLKIERVRTRAIIISEFLLGISNSFFACVGIGVIFLVIFEGFFVCSFDYFGYWD